MGHRDGHFAGHFGQPTSLGRRLLGFAFDYLWLGNRSSILRPAVLAPINSAIEDVTPTGYNPSFWSRGLFQFGTAGSAWRGQVASLGNFDEDLLLVLVFRARAAIGVQVNLASKREGSPNFLGWETFLDASGRLVTTVDSDASASQVLGTATDLVTSQLPQVVAVRISAGLLELASVFEEVSLALNPGSFQSSASLSAGAGRLATSTNIEIGFVGLVIDRPTAPVAPSLQQNVVLPIAAELTMSLVQGSDVVDASGADVYAWNPEYL